MALTITWEGKGVIAYCDGLSDTGGGTWSEVGGGSIEYGQDAYLTGSGCIAGAYSNKTGRQQYALSSALDFDTGGNEEGQFLYIWIQTSTIYLHETITNGGLTVCFGTSAGADFRTFMIAAGDATNGWTGDWKCFVIDPTKPGTVSDSGSFDVGNINYIWVDLDITALAKGNNILIDMMSVGKGLRVTGTSTTPWSDIVSYCTDYSNRAWGCVQEREGIYYVYGTIWFGEDGVVAAAQSFTETAGPIIKFGTSEYYYSSAWVISHPSTYAGIVIEDDSSYTTTFDDGVLVGTDGGRDGSTFIGHDDLSVAIDLYGGSNASSLTRLYGTQFSNISGGINMGDDAQHLFYGGSVTRCGTFDPVGAPIIRNVDFINCQPSQGALKWNSSINVQKCNFIANADTGAAGIDIWTAGTYGFTDLYFSGNLYDLFIVSSLATLVDSYAPTEDGDVDVYSGSITRVAQQFTATAGQLTHASFSIRKQGSPTGNVYIKLYANSGGAPTGTALATSKAYDIADLTTSFDMAEFEFIDEYTLVAATDYHISVEYTGGDSSNRLEVEYLTAGSGSETCNTYVSSWSSQTYDCRFFVNRDGYVKINATDSNPSTYTMQIQPKGSVNIVNSVNLTITVKDEAGVVIQNAQTSIYTDDASRTELMNEDTSALGIAQASYNYVGDQDIEVRVRKASGGTNYVNFSTLGKIESGGYTLSVILKEDPNNAT